MALAETPDERAATTGVFAELKAKEARVARRVADLERQKPTVEDPEQAVEAAMSGLDRLIDLAAVADPGYAELADLFGQVNARLYLRFREEPRGRRVFNVPAGGVLTFGSVPLDEGPTDRAIIRQMIASGKSVSSVPGPVAPGQSESGPEVGRSANVQRVTRRGTRPGGTIGFWDFVVP